jgi:hypothetical protein
MSSKPKKDKSKGQESDSEAQSDIVDAPEPTTKKKRKKAKKSTPKHPYEYHRELSSEEKAVRFPDLVRHAPVHCCRPRSLSIRLSDAGFE